MGYEGVVEDVYNIKGRGTIAVARTLAGKPLVGDTLRYRAEVGVMTTATVRGVEYTRPSNGRYGIVLGNALPPRVKTYVQVRRSFRQWLADKIRG